MSTALLGGLAALALLDSTSIGTLVVPLWLLLAPGQVAVRRLLSYLAVIAGFYWLVGIALLLVAHGGTSWLAGAADSWPLRLLQLAVGVALFALSFRFDPKRRRSGAPDRVARWRNRALGQGGSATSTKLPILALTAGSAELVTMIPYLAAIGLLTAADLSVPQSIPLLAAYCVVMIVPALVLLILRVIAHRRIAEPLARLDAFLTRHADNALSATLGIVGVLVGLNALGPLIELVTG